MAEYKGKLLVLDDDVELRALLSNYLGSRGYLVRQAEDAQHLDTLLARESFDILILDLMMPGEDGLSICKRLRLAGEVIPILMLTARGETIDRIIGLEMGADDYLGKPFEPRELLARLDAMLRRQTVLGAHHKRYAELRDGFGEYQLDIAARRLLRNGQELPIHSAEFDLLQVLLANRGRPLSRERLLDLTHGRGADVTERSIDVQILRLRRLLEEDPSSPRHIVTVRGKGYMLANQEVAP
jgi:two-component system, OmpR family, phosphate regulon response regulator OmpR